MNSPPRDAGIPVLTEVIEPVEPVATASQAATGLTDADWERLEMVLSERILQQLLSRVDQVLELKVRDCLADALQASVARVADELHAGLRQSLAQTIAVAVTQEISRTRASTAQKKL